MPSDDAARPTTPIPLATDDALAVAVEQARAGVSRGVPHALFMLEVPRLVEVAAPCGEAGARALLHVVLSCIYNQIGDRVIAARPGPERIALLRSRCLPRDALVIARRPQAALEGGVFTWKGLSFRLGVSVGVLELDDVARSAEEVLARAGEACTTARSFGGEGIFMYEGKPGEREAAASEREWREHVLERLG